MTEKECTSRCNLCKLFLDRSSDVLECTGSWREFKGSGNANSVYGVRIDPYDELALVARCSNIKREPPLVADVVFQDRLRERLRQLEHSIWKRRGYEVGSDADQHHAEYDRVKFIESIVIPRLGERHIPHMKCARLYENGGRHDSGKEVLLMTDATVLGGSRTSDTICVEIKPKFGSILTCDTIPLHVRPLKHSSSRYSLHQTLKLEQGTISSRSAYDPLDLFSNEKQRMVRALLALFENPQNNLNVFLGGNRCAWNGDVARSIVQHSLQLPLGTSCVEETLSIILAEILLQEGVLQNILRMQNTSQYDVQAVEKLAHKLVYGEVEESYASNVDEPSSTALERLLHSDEETSMDILADYCIAATAKDCSVMISFSMSEDAPNRCQSPRPCGTGIIRTNLGRSCAYRVTVVDLDRKKLEKIETHAKLDREIIRANSLC